VIKVLHLVCRNVEPVVQRLRQRAADQGRADDADERVIRQRLALYQRVTAQLLTYYPPESVATIDALRSPAEVLDQILHVLIPLLNSRQARPADKL
jgi:adenylate kinase